MADITSGDIIEHVSIAQNGGAKQCVLYLGDVLVDRTTTFCYCEIL